jgi:hypothetical protein
MRIFLATVALLTLVPLAAPGAEGLLYRWVDNEGLVHFGDSIPAEYIDLERQIINEYGVTVGVLRAKRTDEEIAEDKRRDKIAIKQAIQNRMDEALLATYLSVDEIVLHRDRRVELFLAQSPVTELYLTNLNRRLGSLQKEASRYRPYSDDPDAETIDLDLAGDISTTEDTIQRHQANLERFQDDAMAVVDRFDGDINRFKKLKGLN